MLVQLVSQGHKQGCKFDNTRSAFDSIAMQRVVRLCIYREGNFRSRNCYQSVFADLQSPCPQYPIELVAQFGRRLGWAEGVVAGEGVDGEGVAG